MKKILAFLAITMILSACHVTYVLYIPEVPLQNSNNKQEILDVKKHMDSIFPNNDLKIKKVIW